MLNRFKRNKGKKVSLAQPPPRPLEEIQKDYQQTTLSAGQAQYQVYIYTREVENLNKRLMSINQEAAARNQLDAEAAKKEAEQKQGADNEPKSQG